VTTITGTSATAAVPAIHCRKRRASGLAIGRVTHKASIGQTRVMKNAW
jgi:hypothetical protein